MARSLLAQSISTFVADLLDGMDEIVHVEAAQEFIRDHGDVIGFHIEGIVAKYIADELKARGKSPAPPLGQGVLFRGLPAAITVRDGVTKPVRSCTKPDLKAGREYKVANLHAANEALAAYDFDCRRLFPLMPDDTVTVAEAASRIQATA